MTIRQKFWLTKYIALTCTTMTKRIHE